MTTQITDCALNLTVINGCGALIQLQTDLCGTINAEVSGGDRYAFHVTVCGGSGASVVITKPGFKTINHRLTLADGHVVPIPYSGSWELQSETLVADRPEPQSRDAQGKIQVPFQGRRVRSKAYSDQYSSQYGYDGMIPYFGAALEDFAAVGDGDQILDQISDFSHVMMYLTHGGPGYNELGQPYGNDQIVKESDALANWDTLWIPLVDNVISRGKIPVYCLDGEGSPDWIRANFESFVARMRQGYDRLAYGPINVCFDGVWPDAWTPDQVKDTLVWMRQVLGPSGMIFFWFGDGPAGSPYLYVFKEDDYDQPWMDGLDGVLTTTSAEQVQCPSLPNYAQYMCDGLTPFGPCSPQWHGPFILSNCSRGKRFWGVVEWNTYDWVRNRVTEEAINTQRDTIKQLSIECFG